MDYMSSQACDERFEELKNEHIQAVNMISQGRPLPLTNLLREALANIAQEVQSALNDHAVPTADDVALFCAKEAERMVEKNQNAKREVNNYAFTLFYLSLSCLCLSKTEICH